MSTTWAGRTVRNCSECGKTFTTPRSAPAQLTCGWECRAERERRRLRLRTYGIGVDRFDELWKAQGERCGICGRRQEDRSTGQRRFAIDHDHACCPGNRSCGKCVRGILCATCNTGLGGFADSIPRLRAAIEYLESHRITTERFIEADWGTAWIGDPSTR